MSAVGGPSGLDQITSFASKALTGLTGFSAKAMPECFKTAGSMFSNASPMGKAAMAGALALGGVGVAKGASAAAGVAGNGLAGLGKMVGSNTLQSLGSMMGGGSGPTNAINAAASNLGGTQGTQNQIQENQEAGMASSLNTAKQTQGDNTIFQAALTAIQNVAQACQAVWKAAKANFS